jgi:hypothetical protein
MVGRSTVGKADSLGPELAFLCGTAKLSASMRLALKAIGVDSVRTAFVAGAR